MSKFLEFVGSSVTFIFLIAAGLAFDGFVFSTMWNWFMVGSLNLPVLNVAQAAGIVLMISAYKTNPLADNADTTISTALKKFLNSAWLSTVFLFVGYLLQLFF